MKSTSILNLSAKAILPRKTLGESSIINLCNSNDSSKQSMSDINKKQYNNVKNRSSIGLITKCKSNEKIVHELNKNISVQQKEFNQQNTHNFNKSIDLKNRLKTNKSQQKNRSIYNELETSNEVEKKLSQKNQKLAYQCLLRNYQKALQIIKPTSKFTKENLADILYCLGYLHFNMTKQQEELLNTLHYLIGGRAKGVTKDNLFLFLQTITNLKVQDNFAKRSTFYFQKNQELEQQQIRQTDKISISPAIIVEIGSFDQKGQWVLTQNQKVRIRKIFGGLVFNKISNDEIKYKKSSRIEQYSFHPQTLKHSRVLAVAHRQKMANELKEITQNKLKGQIDLSNLLMKSKEVTVSKNLKKKKQNQQKLLKQCTFNPKINKVQFFQCTASKDRCIQLFDSSKNKQKFYKNSMTSIQELQERQFKQCTFKPAKISKYSLNLKVPIVKNKQRSVERIRQSRQLQSLQKAIQQRGYPKEISWNRFLEDYKKKSNPSASQQKIQRLSTFQEKMKTQYCDKRPILTLNLKLMNQTENLEVYEGDSIENLTCKILVKNQFPYQYFSKIYDLINMTLNQYSNLIVLQGFIYLTK